MKRLFIILSTFIVTVIASAQPVRTESVLRNDWKFTRSDGNRYADADYDDSSWQSVTVPHDWAISGPFDNNNDKQTVAIEQNGETVATEKTGRTGSLPWTGIGWYRRAFTVSDHAQRVILNLDGAMSEPEVYVNGVKVGASTSAVPQHWQLTTGALFFADEDGEEDKIETAEIRFWNVALTPEQASQLGKAGD